ncbi:unnamed protein product [Caenorhabditis brenneri]
MRCQNFIVKIYWFPFENATAQTNSDPALFHFALSNPSSCHSVTSSVDPSTSFIASRPDPSSRPFLILISFVYPLLLNQCLPSQYSVCLMLLSQKFFAAWILLTSWQTKTSIEEFEISGYELSADVMRKTLDAVQRINISLVLCIKPFVLVAFGYNFSGRLPERLKVESAYWFTMRNLMQARTCAHIDLYSSRLTIQDMQEFMSRWKQGEFPNLEYLQASSNSFNITDYPDFEDRQNTVQRNKR